MSKKRGQKRGKRGIYQQILVTKEAVRCAEGVFCRSRREAKFAAGGLPVPPEEAGKVMFYSPQEGKGYRTEESWRFGTGRLWRRRIFRKREAGHTQILPDGWSAKPSVADSRLESSFEKTVSYTHEHSYLLKLASVLEIPHLYWQIIWLTGISCLKRKNKEDFIEEGKNMKIQINQNHCGFLLKDGCFVKTLSSGIYRYIKAMGYEVVVEEMEGLVEFDRFNH